MNSIIMSSDHNSQDFRLIWHRRDLRLHDNPLYPSDERACCMSVYVFDAACFRPRPSTCTSAWNAVDYGPHAARVLIEAVADLRDRLRAIGGELLIRCGDPVEIIPKLAQDTGATNVCWSEEPGVYEARISRKVRIQLSDKVKSITHCSCTLYHPDDLPRHRNEWALLAHPKQQKSKKSQGSNKHIPTITHPANVHSIVDVSSSRFEGAPPVMGDFRRACRTHKPLRPTTPAPTSLTTPNLPSHLESGEIPCLLDLLTPLLDSNLPILGMDKDTISAIVSSAQNRGQSDDPLISRGGESHALRRLHHFVSDGHASTAERSLADVSGNGSSKLAVHLAMGSISPRAIVELAEQGGDDCTWLISHLEMRDFFLYSAFIAKHRMFDLAGMPVNKKAAASLEWRSPSYNAVTTNQWERWAMGQTGLPLVDAAMIELQTSGYCSNRVRQNAASVLTKDLGLDWRAGAEWFQLLLEDHCVGANWGNWQYFAGVGGDPKHRHFRTVSS
jgi:deoxyribodipyrimidine photo-lyase